MEACGALRHLALAGYVKELQGSACTELLTKAIEKYRLHTDVVQAAAHTLLALLQTPPQRAVFVRTGTSTRVLDR